ncbi:DNA ligase [Candidatus Woesearchaeota archaeon]|nr:DNA ligase [Candidatus Woesearchaeota archaeon]|tara:strand:- start:8324 stop:10057 length:1734 start_codon:yes stop_codon:yes gene_type:complete
MKYSELAEVYRQLSSTTKRLEKTEHVAEFLKKVHADETEEVVLLLQGRIFPAWDERELGVAAQLMAKAISLASGNEISSIKKEWKKTGDLGDVAENLIKGKKQHTLASSELTVKKVFSNLRKLAEESGGGSVDRKLQLIAELLSSSKGNEAKYITRTILGVLRVGLGEGTLRDSIVWANFMKVTDDMDKEKREKYNSFVDAVQEAYDLTNDFAVVAKISKEKGVKGLKSVQIKIGKPIKVMLALKTENATEAFETVGKPASVEFKYDGFRLEIEKDEKGNITLFTRRLDNVVEQFPDVVEHVKKHVKGDSFILDAEAVGYDRKTMKYLPFQNISQRIKRKYDIDKIAKELPVEVNVFDILAYNGKNLLNEPFKKRREIIEKIVDDVKRKIRPAEAIVTDKEEKIEEFFKKAREAGNEGLMIKNLEAPYKPGARVGYMLKFKKVAENLDLVVVEAEWGEGKRSKWLSSYNLACRKYGKLLEVGKVATGLKEKPEEGLSFDEMTQMLKPLIVEEHGKHVKVKPKIILEVGYEEIQKSPSYSSGYALRFPRVIRNRTSEKNVNNINTLKDVEKLYEQQKK